MAAGVACAAGLAYAADQTILGKSLTVTKRKIAASGKEKNSPDTLVGNPTLAGSAGGAILEVRVVGPSSSSNQVFVLAQGTSSTGKPFWTAIGNPSAPTGYKYKDPKGDQGPVRAVTIKRSPSAKFSLNANISSNGGPVVVVQPNPGASGCVALKLGIAAGAGDRYSLQFGPDSQIQNKGDKLMKAKKPVLQGVCPAPGPTTTSTSTT